MAKVITPEAALQKIFRYCAYQERSHRQVKEKLYSYSLRTNEVDEIMVRLITEGFLNEERFAKAFAGGKFRMKSWGKMKIVKGLEAHGVSSRCIQRGLAEIEQDDYKKTLRLLLNKKLKEIDSTNSFAAKHELSKYLIRKGYEPELVWSEIKSIEQSLD